MKLETGKTYLVTCQRKGTFAMRVTGQCGTWTNGVVVDGKTTAMLDYNVAHVGDEITCRTAFIQRAIEQPEAA